MDDASRVGDWKILKKIGCGSFGDIFLGVNVYSSKYAAVKIEKSDIKNSQLLHEYNIYKMLGSGSGVDNYGIPEVFQFEKFSSSSAMVMELLGPSLEDLFNFCKRKFSLHTVLMLADQLLHRMEYIHQHHVLHRDVKPDNFLFHHNYNKPIIYIIDYGLSKIYYQNNEHIPYRENKLLTGTARYASLNTHLGFEQSRRDDLESLGYVLLYFLNGELPWQGIDAKNKNEKYDLIMEVKAMISMEKLTEGREEFIKYMEYCRSLGFIETPDYKYLRGLFRNALRKENLEYDFNFDWVAEDRVSAVSNGVRNKSVNYGRDYLGNRTERNRLSYPKDPCRTFCRDSHDYPYRRNSDTDNHTNQYYQNEVPQIERSRFSSPITSHDWNEDSNGRYSIENNYAIGRDYITEEYPSSYRFSYSSRAQRDELRRYYPEDSNRCYNTGYPTRNQYRSYGRYRSRRNSYHEYEDQQLQKDSNDEEELNWMDSSNPIL
jgi:casein kinase I family protein HRR25